MGRKKRPRDVFTPDRKEALKGNNVGHWWFQQESDSDKDEVECQPSCASPTASASARKLYVTATPDKQATQDRGVTDSGYLLADMGLVWDGYRLATVCSVNCIRLFLVSFSAGK
jgi:hypothetical protein